MSGRTAGWLAWSAWVFTVLAMALTLFLTSLNEPSSSFSNTALLSLLILAFSTVGALVASRRPENPIGWLFCSGALVWILGELALEYGVYTLITAPGALPAGAWMVWFGTWARGIGWFLIVVFLLLLFPTGRLPSPRWRPVLWGAVAFIAFFTLVVWLLPESADFRLTFVRNPLGLELEIMNQLVDVVFLAVPLLLVASGTAVIVRFRRSRGDERQQLKWFAYAVAVMVVLFVLLFPFAAVGSSTSRLPFVVPLIGLPMAVGVAILKHQPLRHRRHRQLNAGLRCAHSHSGGHLPRWYRRAPGSVSRPHGPGVRASRRCLYPGHRRPVLTPPSAHPGFYRPSLLPQEVRCGEDLGSL